MRMAKRFASTPHQEVIISILAVIEAILCHRESGSSLNRN